MTKVSVAANPTHKFPKQCSHVTTANFLQFNVATVMEKSVSNMKGRHKSFIRTFPLKRPLLSNVEIRKQAYFVPYRTIWEPWSDFRTDTPHNQPAGTGIIANTPLISMYTLIQLFKTGDYASVVTGASLGVPADNHKYDFVADVSGTATPYKFTAFGRWANKLFNSMGLRIPFRDVVSSATDITLDCLPLLAVAKVYIDYFFPNQYAHYGVYATIDGIMQRHVTYTLTQSEIDTILKAIYLVAYNSDYFVSAFDNPVTPSPGTFSTDFVISDITVTGNSSDGYKSKVQNDTSNNAYGTPRVIGVNSSGTAVSTVALSQFSQYIDSQLKALSNYIRRHSLAGSRALTRYLADWGVTLTADKLKRCYKLGEVSFPLQIGEVTSTADTIQSNGDGAQLGDYSGRAVAFNGDFDIECDTDEDGLFVVTYSIIPSISYVQGIQRYWMHKTKLDFLTGDFDGVYVREIHEMELFSGMKRARGKQDIFAFIQSYAENKISYDVQSGDFMCDSVNLGLQGFESARLWSDQFQDADFAVQHSLDFVIGNDFAQYNRVFFDDEDDADKFVCIHRFECNDMIPAVPLYDSYDFEDGKKQIKLHVNGSKDN